MTKSIRRNHKNQRTSHETTQESCRQLIPATINIPSEFNVFKKIHITKHKTIQNEKTFTSSILAVLIHYKTTSVILETFS